MSTNQNKTNNHSYFMRLALMQAKKNLGNTKDNPSVGCVVVNNNNVISSGCTSINGRPHAEFNALNFIKKKLSNSNLYVTLEPCSNLGKTPPCVNLIKNKKIKNVFFIIFSNLLTFLLDQNLAVNSSIFHIRLVELLMVDIF